MKPRYTAASTLNLRLHFLSFAGVSLAVFLIVTGIISQRFPVIESLVWTAGMCALVWRVQAVRRYEILEDRIRFVGVLGSTTLPFRQIEGIEVIEARMLYFLPIGRWRRAVQIKRERLALSLTPNTVFVRDTDAFVRALNTARLTKPPPYSVSVQRPPRP